jgi:hypothetical protein
MENYRCVSVIRFRRAATCFKGRNAGGLPAILLFVVEAV